MTVLTVGGTRNKVQSDTIESDAPSRSQFVRRFAMSQ